VPEIKYGVSPIFGQFRMGLYRDYIYENLLWTVADLRNDIKSLAELDLSPSEYENMLSFKNFNLEMFLSTDPEIRKRRFYPYYYDDDVCYDSEGDNIHHLYELRLGMDHYYEGWSKEYNSKYKIPRRNRKEEYICALEIVNRIEKLAEELIKDYTPPDSKKISNTRF